MGKISLWQCTKCKVVVAREERPKECAKIYDFFDTENRLKPMCIEGRKSASMVAVPNVVHVASIFLLVISAFTIYNISHMHHSNPKNRPSTRGHAMMKKGEAECSSSNVVSPPLETDPAYLLDFHRRRLQR